MKQHIPNLITLCNLFCGTCAIACIFLGYWEAIFPLIFMALLFDFADGFVARALNVHSDLGKQLDSLADMVSFGVVPGCMLFNMLYTANYNSIYWGAPGFVVTLFSAVRLAKFNLDTRQSDVFIGLATPACTTFVLGLWIIAKGGYTWAGQSGFLYCMIPVLSYLLVAEIPMFSNKFKGMQWKQNEIRYLFALLTVLSLAIFGTFAFAPLVALYVLTSVAMWLLGYSKI